MKMTKTMLCGATIALLAVVLVACGTGAPARAAGDLVSVPIFEEWFYEDDQGRGGGSSITFTEVVEDGMPAWSISGWITRDILWGDVVWGWSELSDRTRELFRSADAISFMVRGDGQRYRLMLQVPQVRDYGHFAVGFDTVAGEAIRITVPIRHFMQPSWAAMIGRFRPENLTGVVLATDDSIHAAPHEAGLSSARGYYDLTMWDFRLYVPEGTTIPPIEE